MPRPDSPKTLAEFQARFGDDAACRAYRAACRWSLVYTNRHNLPREIAVKMSNTDLYNLVKDRECGPRYLNPRYAEGLLQITMAPGRRRAGE